ncbi:MAG TPA: hypothetical protein VFC68_05210 [Treponemataceae bacterium]|nr:hypothetical protein [Treponemataceae bacterium]
MKKKNFTCKTPFILTSIFVILLQSPLLASSFSTSTATVAFEIAPPSIEHKTNASLKTQYATQIQIGSLFSLHGKFSVRTDNMIDAGFFTETPAFFSIDEFSAAYCFNTPTLSGQISSFVGSFELPGTDSFGSKYLGIQNIISPLLYPFNSIDSVEIYPIDGIGIAVGTRFISPSVAAFYLYLNGKDTYTPTTNDFKKFINVDTRVARVSDNFFIDFAAGSRFPIKAEVIDTEIHLITQIDFHTMLTMVIGGNPYTNMFFQAGISAIPLKPQTGNQYISFEDMFLFIEPRFSTKKLRFSFSFFCIPKNKTQALNHIDKPVGTALTFSSMPILICNTPGETGCIISASIPNPAVEAYMLDKLDLQIAPYITFLAGAGTFSAKVHIHPLRYNDIGSMFLCNAGYKIRL